MRSFDLSPLYRSTIGFDRLFSMLKLMAPSIAPKALWRVIRPLEKPKPRAHFMIVAGLSRPQRIPKPARAQMGRAPPCSFTGVHHAQF